MSSMKSATLGASAGAIAFAGRDRGAGAAGKGRIPQVLHQQRHQQVGQGVGVGHPTLFRRQHRLHPLLRFRSRGPGMDAQRRQRGRKAPCLQRERVGFSALRPQGADPSVDFTQFSPRLGEQRKIRGPGRQQKGRPHLPPKKFNIYSRPPTKRGTSPMPRWGMIHGAMASSRSQESRAFRVTVSGAGLRKCSLSTHSQSPSAGCPRAFRHPVDVGGSLPRDIPRVGRAAAASELASGPRTVFPPDANEKFLRGVG